MTKVVPTECHEKAIYGGVTCRRRNSENPGRRMSEISEICQTEMENLTQSGHHPSVEVDSSAYLLSIKQSLEGKDTPIAGAEDVCWEQCA